MRTSAEVSNIAFDYLAHVVSWMWDSRRSESAPASSGYLGRPIRLFQPNRSWNSMAEKSAGTVAEVFAAFLKLGPHLVRRTDRASRLLQVGIRRTAKMAQRKQLRRYRRTLPVLAGASFQPGRLHAWHPARQRPARRACGVVRLHHAVGPHSLRLRARCDGFHRPLRRRRAPRPEAGRGRRGRAGDLGHGQQPDAGSRAGCDRACGGCDRGFHRRIVWPDRRHRSLGP